MEIIGNIFYFVVVIGLLITVHEFGHFISAVITGMRAEIFCIGMGPRLFGWNKKIGFTFGKLNEEIDLEGNTDYRIAIFPIGGYVKISGMIDESLDTEYMNQPPKHYEFRSKGSFAKILVMSGGVLMNFVLTAILFSIIAFSEGKTELVTTTIGNVEYNSVAEKIGFVAEDKVLTINNAKVKTWNDVIEFLTLKDFGEKLNIEVSRNNQIVKLSIDGDKLVKLFAQKSPLGLSPGGIEVYIQNVIAGKPAEKAGLKPKDKIYSANDVLINTTSKLQETLKQNKSKTIPLVIVRNNQTINVNATVTADGFLGIQLKYEPITKSDYGIFESLKFGVTETVDKTLFVVTSISQIFKGNVSVKESVAGPVMIFDMTSKQAEAGFISLLNFVAMLSISLGFINILPLPALDGGHIAVLLIEGIVRRELPTKYKLYIQQAGIILIILFSIFVIFNDVSRFF